MAGGWPTTFHAAELVTAPGTHLGFDRHADEEKPYSVASQRLIKSAVLMRYQAERASAKFE
jgi:hypothetical protein